MNFIVVSYPETTLIECHGLLNRIELHGTGSLAVCNATFSNGDEQNDYEMQEIIFAKTEHPTECILTPHKIINLSDYSYCSLKIFSGNLHKGDRILLYYSPVLTSGE